MPKHKYSVKKVITFTGREGVGVNADVYRGSNKVALFRDMADGAEPVLDWLYHIDRRVEEGFLRDHIKGMPDLHIAIGCVVPMTPEMYIDELVNAWLAKKERKGGKA